MRLIGAAVLALSCVASVASASEPMAFSRDHPTGYPSSLLSYGYQYHAVFSIGPEVEHMPLKEIWVDAKQRKIADDEVKFYLGKLRYVSYLNNLCGGTECTVTANLQAYVQPEFHAGVPFRIVRLTLNGSSSYMEAYMYEDSEGISHVFSRGESGWIKKCLTAEAPDFTGILNAALNLVWEEKFRVR